MERITIKSEKNSNTVVLPWSAIISGLVVSLSCELLLIFLGIAVGFFLFNTSTVNAYSLELGSSIWLLISGILSVGIGFWVVRNFYLIQSNFNRAYVGLITWGCVTVVILLIAKSTVSAIIGMVASIIGSSILKYVTDTLTQNQTQNLLTPSGVSNKIQPDKLEDKNSDNSKVITDLVSSSILLFIELLSSAITHVLDTIYSKPTKLKVKKEKKAQDI